MSSRLSPCLLCCLAVVIAAPCATAATPPDVMLPVVYRGGLQLSGYLVSEKLDGVRGRWDGRHLYTRSGQSIRVPAWFTAGWPATPMDGELWIARGRFETISALVRTDAPADDAWREVRFMVFDLPEDPAAFEARAGYLRSLANAAGVPTLQAVAQFGAAAVPALDAELAAVIAAGGEGLVLHRRDAYYHAGRSDDLLKYKPFDDAEARVVGYSPGEGKYAGMLGALLVERADGLRFRIGSGLDDAQRAQPPAIGSTVTYRHNGFGANGVPRFARFLRVREDEPQRKAR